MRFSLFSALCVACVVGCAAPSSPQRRPVVLDEHGRRVSELLVPPDRQDIVLPLKPDGALLATDDVKVNGRHVGAFVIDTGAMCSAVDREVAQELGLMNGRRLRDRRDSALRAPDGLYHVDALDVGAVGVRNHVIAVVDLSSVRRRGRRHLAGVLGADVFALMPFTIDYGRRELTFHARPHFRPPPATSAMASRVLVARELKAPRPFSLANPRAGVPSVPVRIDGLVTDAVIDTGSGGSILLTPALLGRRPQWIQGGGIAVARAAGAGSNAGVAGYGLPAARVQTVDLLGVRFTGVPDALAIIDDLPRAHDSPVIGTKLLSNLRLTFDYAAGKVWVGVK